MRNRLIVGAAIAAAVVLAVTVPGLASAAEALGDDRAAVGNRATSYDFRTTVRSWSVVSLRSQQGANFDLTVHDGPNAFASRYGSGTDFVLIDSTPGLHPLGPYRADVARQAGNGWYSVRFNQTNPAMRVPTNARPSNRNVLRTTTSSPVTVLQLNFEADQGFRLLYPPNTSVYVLVDSPGRGPVISRADAVSRDLLVGGSVFGAWRTGSSATGGCVAYADPALPDTARPVLVLVDDDPMGAREKTFHPFAYDRWTDTQKSCPAL